MHYQTKFKCKSSMFIKHKLISTLFIARDNIFIWNETHKRCLRFEEEKKMIKIITGQQKKKLRFWTMSAILWIKCLSSYRLSRLFLFFSISFFQSSNKSSILRLFLSFLPSLLPSLLSARLALVVFTLIILFLFLATLSSLFFPLDWHSISSLFLSLPPPNPFDVNKCV